MRGAGRANDSENHRNPTKLSEYVQGQKGRIVKVLGDGESRRRISEMGFTRGAEVQVVKYAPLSDPVEYLVKGYHVSLSRVQAANILVAQSDKEALTDE